MRRLGSADTAARHGTRDGQILEHIRRQPQAYQTSYIRHTGTPRVKPADIPLNSAPDTARESREIGLSYPALVRTRGRAEGEGRAPVGGRQSPGTVPDSPALQVAPADYNGSAFILFYHLICKLS